MRKELLVILVFVLVSMLICSFGFPHTNSSAELANGLSQTYGGIESDISSSLVETSDGGYIIAGYTYSVGAGNSDVWLVKTDEHGVIPENNRLTLGFLFLGVALLVLKLAYNRRRGKH